MKVILGLVVIVSLSFLVANTSISAYSTYGNSTSSSNSTNANTTSSSVDESKVKAIPVLSSSIILNFIEPTNSRDQDVTYTIDRSDDGGHTWSTVVNTVSLSSAGFTDRGLSPNTTYTYRIFAIKPSGESTLYAITSATTFIPTVGSGFKILTDKPVYTFGDKIIISGKVLPVNAYPNFGISVSSKTAYGTDVNVYSNTIRVNPDGTFLIQLQTKASNRWLLENGGEDSANGDGIYNVCLWTDSGSGRCLDQTSFTMKYNNSPLSKITIIPSYSHSYVNFTATVTDTSNLSTTPTGSVSWTDGTEPPSCTLAYNGNCPTSSVKFYPITCTLSSGSCTVTYTPASYPNRITITAYYDGDTVHQYGMGFFTLNVTELQKVPPPPPEPPTLPEPIRIPAQVSGFDNSHLNGPAGVAVDSTGNIYVSDTQRGRVQIFDSTGKYKSTIGSFGTADNSHFQGPSDIAFDTSGNLYVVDSGNHRVQKFDSTGKYKSKIGCIIPNGQVCDPGRDNSHFYYPSSIAVDSFGNVYVTDTTNRRVQIFNPDETYKSTIGVTGSDNSQVISPTGIAIDSSGNIYVADTSNNRVQIFDSTGKYKSTIGSFGTGNSQFISPTGIAIDSSGNIYVADTSNNRVQIFNSDGTYKSTIGVTQTHGSQFWNPSGVAVDSSGNIYVADTSNNRILKFAGISQSTPTLIIPATTSQPTTISTPVLTPTQQDIQDINQAKASQTIVAEVNVGTNNTQTTSIDNSISVQTTQNTPDSLGVKVSANNQTGPKVIMFNLAATTINIQNLKDLGVMYDGKPIQPAPNMDAILHAKPTDNPSFAIVVTQSGVQVLVLIPHFSTHTITITNMSKVIPVVPEFGSLVGIIITISVIGSLVIFRRFSKA